MKKILLIFVLSLVGCSLSVPRSQFMASAKDSRYGSKLLEKYPSYAFCFNLSKEEAAAEMDRLYMDYIERRPIKIDPVSPSEAKEYGAKIRRNIHADYFYLYRKHYLEGNPTESQKKDCKAFFSDEL